MFAKSNHQVPILVLQLLKQLELRIANQQRLLSAPLCIVSPSLFADSVLSYINNTLIKRHHFGRLQRVSFIDHRQSEIESALLTPQSPIDDYGCDVYNALFQGVFDQRPFIYIKVLLQHIAPSRLIQ